MKFKNFVKYHYGKQLYKRSTGWYDHYNTTSDGDDGCLSIITILLIIGAFVIGFGVAKVFIVLGVIALIGIGIGAWLHEDEKARKADMYKVHHSPGYLYDPIGDKITDFTKPGYVREYTPGKSKNVPYRKDPYQRRDT